MVMIGHSLDVGSSESSDPGLKNISLTLAYSQIDFLSVDRSRFTLHNVSNNSSH